MVKVKGENCLGCIGLTYSIKKGFGCRLNHKVGIHAEPLSPTTVNNLALKKGEGCPHFTKSTFILNKYIKGD